MHPVLLELGPLRVYSYGALISLGGVLSFLYLWTRRARLGLDENGYWALVNLILVSGFLGGKLLYVLQYGAVWSFGKGYSVMGAIAAVTASVAVYGRRNALAYLDTLAVMLPLWHAFGRLGCFLAGCCHGKPTSWPWGVTFTDPRALVPAAWLGVPLHPTQLLESAGDALIAALAWKTRDRRGLPAFFYLAGYGMLRVGLETLRGDVKPFAGPLTQGQGFGLAMLASAAVLLAWRAKCSPSC